MKDNTNLFNPFLILFCFFISTWVIVTTKPYILASSISWYIAAILSFFVALFLLSGLGMLFEEKSRLGGTLLLSVFLPYIYFYWNQNNILRLDGMVPGLLAGMGFLLQSFSKNQFNIVAKNTRFFLKIFFIGVLFYLFSIFKNLVNEESLKETPQHILTGSNELFMFMLSFFALLVLYVVLKKHVIGIKASDVFVYGPSKSGKTLLLLSLYDQFVNYYEGQRNEVLISSSSKASSREEDSREEDYYRIENMLAELRNGKLPKSNKKTDLTLYTLKGKKCIKPIEFSFVDYGGEFTENLTPDDYQNAILNLNKRIPDISNNIFDEKIGKYEFVNDLKKKYPEDISYILDQLVLAHIYKKLETAGKIIFLVDGDLIESYRKDGDSLLVKLFGQYSRMINLFGEDKSYAIVVTKTDKIRNITDITENSRDARKIEKEIFDELVKIETFKEIQNMASMKSIYFYAVSANSLKNDDQQEKTTTIYPWRVEQIAKFGF